MEVLIWQYQHKKVVIGAESPEWIAVRLEQITDSEPSDAFLKSVGNGYVSVEELVSVAQMAESHPAQYAPEQLLGGNYRFLAGGKEKYVIELPCDCRKYCSLCPHDDKHNGQ